MARVITIGNRKGGSGKTTTAVCVAAGLAHRGRSVLIVDLDPQAHATLSLGVRTVPSGGMYAVLAEGRPLSEILLPTYRENLRLLPGSRRLSEYERVYTPVREARHRLAEALRPAASSFDFVIMDTPPTLGLLTISALIASTELYIPMQAHYLALDGLADMIRTVATINKLYGTELRIRGVIPTFFQERARLSKAVLADIRSHLGDNAILSPVRTSIALAEAPSHGMSIFQYDAKSAGAMDYLAVVARIDQDRDGEAQPGPQAAVATGRQGIAGGP